MWMYAQTHTCTCTLKAVKLWGNKAPHKNHRLTNSVPEIKPLQAWGVLSKGLPKQYWLPMQPTFGCHSRVEGWTTAEDTTHEDIWPRKPLCHDFRKYYKNYQGRQAIIQLCPAATMRKHNRHQHSRICKGARRAITRWWQPTVSNWNQPTSRTTEVMDIRKHLLLPLC